MIERGRRSKNIQSANGLDASRAPKPARFGLEPVFIE